MKKPSISFDEDNHIYLDFGNEKYKLCVEIDNDGNVSWEFYNRETKFIETNKTNNKKFIEHLLHFKDE